jgi:hypothetical protein
MEAFKGEPGQVERLRAEIRALHARKIKTAELMRRVEKEAESLGISCMSRTDIDKFRTGTVDRPREIEKLVPLWNVVFSDPFLRRDPPPSPDAAKESINPEHEFFYSAVKFFDVHQHRNVRAKTDLLGRFIFYHFSEVFHKFSASIPRAVVVGQWDIDFADGAFRVLEKQDYDGMIGKQERSEFYNGYCLPKGRNICLMLKEAKKETPKFYMLEAEHDDAHTLQTAVLSGHMLKGSHNRKYFHSPVYAVRVPADKDFECNILRCEDVPAPVMHELEALAKRYG